MKLSICMMVRDEAKNLDRCLEKLKPLVESNLAELIIVDTGSTDGTELIAKKYTEKVYFHEWNNDFSAMRNISISYAKGEWIFIIDADERLDDADKLIQLMNSEEINKYNTIRVKVKNLYKMTVENEYNLFQSSRMFRNNGDFKYKGAVHNQPICQSPILMIDINITHFGYIISDKKLMEKKYKRTTTLLKSELEKDSDNLYYGCQLGVSYSMHGDRKEALEQFRRVYGILKNKNFDEKYKNIYAYAVYAGVAYENNEFRESINIAKEGLSLKKDYIDLYYRIGLAEKIIGDAEESYKYLKKYTELVGKYDELDIAKDNSVIMYNIDEKSQSTAYFEIYQYYFNNKKYMEAYKAYKNITINKQKIYSSINILIQLEKHSELREVYINLQTQKEKNVFVCILEEKIKEFQDEDKVDLYKEFSLNKDVYGKLNEIRLNDKIDKKKFLAEVLIDEIDFNEVPVFYSELFVYIKANIKLIIKIFRKIEVWNLRKIVKYLIEEKEFTEIFENYVLQENTDIIEMDELKVYISVSIILMAIYIKDNDEVNEKYLDIFKVYIKCGINFISQLYQVENAEAIYKWVYNEEDRFFLVMYIINKLIANNKKKLAVQYMFKAVNLNKALAKYIDVYKDEILDLKGKKQIEKEKQEFESYKLKVKETIKSLINDGNIQDAKVLINEYSKIISNDIEIYSISAVVAIMEGNLLEAEKILKEGISIDGKSFDLLYNMGYFYESINNVNEALAAYNIARNICEDAELIKIINDRIRELGGEIKKYKVILYGEYNECLKFTEQFYDWDIIGVCNDTRNLNTIYINDLKDYNYDFLFVLEELNREEFIKKFSKYINKDIYFYQDFKVTVIEGLDYKILQLLSRKNIEGIITGLSYAEVGIKEHLLKNNFINFALSSQDLYYDFLLLKYIYEFEEVGENLKYVIINLSYYSFDYDMSIAISKYRIHRYCKYIKEYHHNSDTIGTDIYRSFYEKRITFDDYINMNKKKENTLLVPNDATGEYEALRNSTMDHEHTRCEYEDVFDKYLLFLKEKNIKPIVVICPTSYHYRKHFDKTNKKDLFYNIINKFKKKYEFQVIDYFESDLFEDTDFWDYSHLNGEGADKFTNMLNNQITW